MPLRWGRFFLRCLFSILMPPALSLFSMVTKTRPRFMRLLFRSILPPLQTAGNQLDAQSLLNTALVSSSSSPRRNHQELRVIPKALPLYPNDLFVFVVMEGTAEISKKGDHQDYLEVEGTERNESRLWAIRGPCMAEPIRPWSF